MSPRGTYHRFPDHRKTVLEILVAARGVPAFPLYRTLNVRAVESARKQCTIRIGWTAVFLKAYALVAQSMPQLREVFVPLPKAYLYRHPYSVASVSVHRQDESGQDRLIWSRIHEVETQSLVNIQQTLNHAINQPLAEVYRDGLKLERRPWLARRWCWWMLMNWCGRKRAKSIGTFSISSLAGSHCLNAFHPLLCTTSLAFGPINSNAEMEVVLLCDHRVLDGMAGAQALAGLDETLNTRILGELEDYRASDIEGEGDGDVHRMVRVASA